MSCRGSLFVQRISNVASNAPPTPNSSEGTGSARIRIMKDFLVSDSIYSKIVYFNSDSGSGSSNDILRMAWSRRGEHNFSFFLNNIILRHYPTWSHFLNSLHWIIICLTPLTHWRGNALMLTMTPVPSSGNENSIVIVGISVEPEKEINLVSKEY